MKKVISRILIVFFCVLFLPLTIVCTGFFIPAQFSDTYYGVLGKMYNNLKNTAGKKIVFVGNSSVALGVNSALIEEELALAGADYTVCNFGLYAAVGTKAMLDFSCNYINEGDIVILMIEPDAQAFSSYFSGGEIWRAVDGNWDMLLDVAADNRETLVATFAPFAAEKVKYFVSGEKPASGEVYTAASFDERCDMTNANRPQNVMLNGYDANTLLGFDTSVLNASFLKYINEYYAKINKKGGQMYYAFPPMNKAALQEGGEEKLSNFYESLLSGIDFPILGNPFSYLMDCEWFYDSNVHMNQSGMTYNSLLLLDDIKNQLGITTPNRTSVPQKPDLAEPEEDTTVGDNTYADCFTYEKTAAGYMITGLTEKGMQQKRLVIPYRYAGEVIVQFADNVFAGNTVIEEITVQKNIKIMFDYSFEGCTSLQKLILEQKNPDKISVWHGLLSGAENCTVYVPQESLEAYRLDYFWNYYSGKMQGY